MKLKPLLLVIVVLAALSALVYLIQRPAAPASTDARLGRSLADQAVIEKAAKFRLTDQGKSVTLVRQADGTWRVASYFALPADFAKLTTLVAGLTEAKLLRLVTTSPERIARLGFKDTRLEFLDATDRELWSVTLGKNAETGGGRYARFGSENKAYLASFSSWLDAEPKNWADGQLLNLKPDDIARVEIPFPDGDPVIISRAGKEAAWTADKTPAGQRVIAGKISAVLTSVGNVRFTDTVDPTDPGVADAKAHELVFKLTDFQGRVYTVALGRKPEVKKLKPLPADSKNLPDDGQDKSRPGSSQQRDSAGQTPGGPHPATVLAASTKPAVPDPTAVPAAKDNESREGEKQPVADAKPDATKPPVPEYETIPAGPVFVFIATTDSAAPVNSLMQKRAFQITDYTFTGLPQKSTELFEPVPPPVAPATPARDQAGEPKKN